MLQEITSDEKSDDGLKRRWFTDTALDLFVWLDSEDNIVKFQICYNKGHNEHALSWDLEQNMTHHCIDSGETEPMTMKKSPILIEDGQPDIAAVCNRISQAGKELPAFIYNFVVAELNKANEN